MTQSTALELDTVKALLRVRYLIACISLPAEFTDEEFAWHSVQYNVLCVTLLFVEALPPMPWHVEQYASLLAGFISALSCNLPLLWHVAHIGVLGRSLWLNIVLLKSLT